MTARAGASAQYIKYQAHKQEDPRKRWAQCCAPGTPALNSGGRRGLGHKWTPGVTVRSASVSQGAPHSLTDLVSKLGWSGNQGRLAIPALHTHTATWHTYIPHTCTHTHQGEEAGRNNEQEWEH